MCEEERDWREQNLMSKLMCEFIPNFTFLGFWYYSNVIFDGWQRLENRSVERNIQMLITLKVCSLGFFFQIWLNQKMKYKTNSRFFFFGIFICLFISKVWITHENIIIFFSKNECFTQSSHLHHVFTILPLQSVPIHHEQPIWSF